MLMMCEPESSLEGNFVLGQLVHNVLVCFVVAQVLGHQGLSAANLLHKHFCGLQPLIWRALFTLPALPREEIFRIKYFMKGGS